jgi:hypothetical protein
MTALCFSQLTSPAEQLLRRQSMPSRYRTDLVAPRNDLRNDPRLVLVAPLPPTAGSREDLKPSDWLITGCVCRQNCRCRGECLDAIV